MITTTNLSAGAGEAHSGMHLVPKVFDARLFGLEWRKGGSRTTI